MRCHEVDYEIFGDDMQIVEVELDPGEKLIAEAGAMNYMEDGINFETYLQEEGNLMPDSMHHNSISAIVEDDSGDVWVGSFSHGGISQFRDSRIILGNC